MGNLFNALNGLKTNIFGGGNTGETAPILRKSAIGINEESPTSKLDHDPFAYSSIQYPKDLTSTGGIGHYMLFYVNVQNKTKYGYNAPDGKEVGNVNRTLTEQVLTQPATYKDVLSTDPSDSNYGKVIGRELDTEAKYDTVEVKRENANYFKSDTPGKNEVRSDVVQLQAERGRDTGLFAIAGRNTTTRITDSVAIYLPANVVDSTTAGYTGAATGIVGAAAAGLFKLNKDMANEDFEAAGKGIVDSAKAIMGEAAIKAGTTLIETFTDAEGTRGLANKIFGQADNPYMEVLFDAMNLRTFTYNFTFSPRNREETEDVQKIIQLFRFHMAPELKGQNNRFLTLPSEFDIHYMYQDQSGHASENDYYNKIATCVCTAVETNYTPDGVKSFEGGAPTKITMNLSFQETELLTKERIQKGF